MRLKDDGELRDVRGWAFTGPIEQPKPFGLSQSEIVATLRGQMHMGRPYTLEQLIVDVDALTPEHLDTYAVRLGELVSEFGEQHRRMIVATLSFLDQNEPDWGLQTPIDRRAYVRDLIQKISDED